MKHVIVGTAGHIDHGKSSLVEALTGTHPDRLAEEKRRGITIDLGFAFLNLGEARIGFVDVPGHERFVRNMLAGAGGIDLVLLVVAADDSIKPQTREHFDICRLLDIRTGIIVITKSDLVDADVLGLVRLEIEELVRGSFLESAPILEVSAKTGAGLDALRFELQRAAESVPGKDAGRHFRLPIDRAFAMKGFGVVVTGTLVSGAVQCEDEVELFPLRRRVRVRGLHSGGAAIERAVAGQRTALNLAGIELDELHRGMALTAAGQFQPTRRIDVRLSLLPSAPPLKNRARVHLHHGTAETIAEVVLLSGTSIDPGQSAFAQLRLAAPVLAFPDDPFIIRRFSPVATIGGGVVLDALAAVRRKKDARVLPYLVAMERGDRETVVEILAATELNGLTLPRLIAKTGWLEAEARAAIAKLAGAGEIVVAETAPLTVVPAAAVGLAARRIREELDKFHRANPLVPGIAKEELRGRAVARPEIFRAALAQLVDAGAIAVSGDLVQIAGRDIALTPEESRAKDVIESEFANAGLAVPRFEEVLGKLSVESARARKILQILLREKTLVKVADDLVFHKSAVARLRELIAKYKKTQGDRLLIGPFKDMTGVTRKYAIPLLEFLDRERVTRRVGDERVIL
jgi:selenocysteine-specific elongation factor